jgi:hypothetical protein
MVIINDSCSTSVEWKTLLFFIAKRMAEAQAGSEKTFDVKLEQHFQVIS